MDVKPLTRDELAEVLREDREAMARAQVEGIKYFRIPQMFATPSGGTVMIGDNMLGVNTYKGQQVGPNAGFVWSIRRLTAAGLGTGTSPDLLNIYRSGMYTNPIWQLNGNNWGYSFGPAEMMLLPGENLVAMSVGSLVSTAQIVLSGDGIEVPQAMLGRLVV